MTYRALVKKTISLQRTKVFSMLCDFGGVQRFVPDFVRACRLEGEGVGAIRTLTLSNGGTAIERLDLLHDQTVFGYSLLEHDVPDMLPVANYFSVVVLEDSPGGGTEVTWASNWTLLEPAREAEVRKTMESLYATLLTNMNDIGLGN